MVSVFMGGGTTHLKLMSYGILIAVTIIYFHILFFGSTFNVY
jgi:hypothetical protein